MIKAIIFDAYGTILSTGTGSMDAAKKILEYRNRFDIDPREFYRDWKKHHKTNIKNLKEFRSEKNIFISDLEQLYDDYSIKGNPISDIQWMLNSLENRRAYPESKECLENLMSKYIVAIGSTTDTEPLLKNLADNGINLPVTSIFTSERLLSYKPSKNFYLQILHALNVRHDEALFVGDSLEDDVWGPQRVGIHTCWLNRSGLPSSTVGEPEFVIENLMQLNDMISNHFYSRRL